MTRISRRFRSWGVNIPGQMKEDHLPWLDSTGPFVEVTGKTFFLMLCCKVQQLEYLITAHSSLV
jgi:hypothetical protein